MEHKTSDIWIGVEQLNNAPELNEIARQEFFELPVTEALADEQAVEAYTKGSSRRDFLKYMGFSLGAATLAASCEMPIRKAIPYIVKPDSIVPGIANYFASNFVKGGDYCAVLVKTRDGRPIKIEGNNLSSVTKGATSARAQASVLSLYDTARYRVPQSASGKELSWADLDKAVAGQLNAGSQIRILTNTIISPMTKKAIADFASKYPNTKVVTYDPVSCSALLTANEQSFGQRVVPNYRFDKAAVVVSLGADFMGTWISPIEYAADFAKNRNGEAAKKGTMNRLIALESAMSLTGSNADSRIFVKPSEQGSAIVTLYNAVAALAGGSSVSGGSALSSPKATGAIKQVANDLWEAREKGTLVVSGSNNVGEQMLVNAINNMLGAYGRTISFDRPCYLRQGDDAAVQALSKELVNIDALIVLGDANPVYDLPKGKEFGEALKATKLSVALTETPNETSACCKYVAPTHHILESWGDAEPKQGLYSLTQPTIAPLFSTRQAEHSLLAWAGSEWATKGDSPMYEYLKNFWQTAMYPKQSSYGSFQAFWDNTVHDGVFEVAASGSAGAFAGNAQDAAGKVTKSGGEGMEAFFYEPVSLGNGSYANNPWLQEMPDPVTRVTWDNYAIVSVKWDGDNHFNGLQGLETGDLVSVEVNGQKFELPAVVQFGQMENTCAIALGYGREVAGRAGQGVGKNMYKALNTAADGTTQYFAGGVKITPLGRKSKDFASVQYHHTMGVRGKAKTGEVINADEQVLGHRGFQGSLTNRTIIRTANLPELGKKVEALKEERAEAQHLNSNTIYGGHDNLWNRSHHWNLSVDLTACTGCGACAVACTAENNVPVVGRHEVHRHHEMTWLRIDRYFYGDVENPNVVYQPMMCQHCDNAPCENVCPVAATNHSAEGLNQMTYNRCIGTRYCANNCPYKVRRFNWLDYTTADVFPWNEHDTFGSKDEIPFYADNLTRMVLNPDVTVRSRGVIEKCSFCVQRIQEGKLRAKVEQRKINDGDVKTACQTACPTGAIVFGDRNDASTQISKRIKDELTYKVLEEINVAPNVTYWMRITNKNEKMEA